MDQVSQGLANQSHAIKTKWSKSPRHDPFPIPPYKSSLLNKKNFSPDYGGSMFLWNFGHIIHIRMEPAPKSWIKFNNWRVYTQKQVACVECKSEFKSTSNAVFGPNTLTFDGKVGRNELKI
jgi:hypothetical protein